MPPLQDRPGIQAAFEALLAAALERHGSARGQASATSQTGHPTEQESAPVTPRGPTLPELPLLMQSELGPALRQLTPRRGAVENAATEHLPPELCQSFTAAMRVACPSALALLFEAWLQCKLVTGRAPAH